MVKNYWLDSCTWKNLTGYNEIALIEIFKNRLNTCLVCKLVEIEGMNEELTLEE